jgi:hypothetical protein
MARGFVESRLMLWLFGVEPDHLAEDSSVKMAISRKGLPFSLNMDEFNNLAGKNDRLPALQGTVMLKWSALFWSKLFCRLKRRNRSYRAGARRTCG